MIGTTNGIVQVDGSGGELELNTSTIDQGTVKVDGTLKALTGSSTLSDLGVTTPGTGTGTFTSDGTIEAVTTLVLTDDKLTNVISTTNGIVQVDASGGELDLNSSTIDQGYITDIGTVKVTGLSAIDDVMVTDSNTSTVTPGIDVLSGVLTLDGGTQINSTDDGTLTIGSTGTLDVETLGGSTVNQPDATLDDIIVTDNNAGGGTYNGIEIADAGSGAILKLDGGTTIIGGTLAVELGGVLEITDATGATLDHVVVDNDGIGTAAGSGIYVASGVLTLDGDTQIQGGAPPVGHADDRKRWPGHRRWRYQHRGCLAKHQFARHGAIWSYIGCRRRLRLRNRRCQSSRTPSSSLPLTPMGLWAPGTHTPLPALPVDLGESGATSVVSNGYIYVIGGIANPNAVEYAAINPTNGTLGAWTATTPLPALPGRIRSHFGSFQRLHLCNRRRR